MLRRTKPCQALCQVTVVSVPEMTQQSNQRETNSLDCHSHYSVKYVVCSHSLWCLFAKHIETDGNFVKLNLKIKQNKINSTRKYWVIIYWCIFKLLYFLININTEENIKKWQHSALSDDLGEDFQLSLLQCIRDQLGRERLNERMKKQTKEGKNERNEQQTERKEKTNDWKKEQKRVTCTN